MTGIDLDKVGGGGAVEDEVPVWHEDVGLPLGGEWIPGTPPGGAPSGAAGGVLSGTYPNPTFSADMATQAELDAHIADTTAAHAATAISFSAGGGISSTTVQAAIAELDTEKAALASPVFTGNPTAPTPAAADNDTSIATTAFVQGEIAAKAPLASPTFTGNPLAPTPAFGDSDTSIATTAFVQAAVAGGAPPGASGDAWSTSPSDRIPGSPNALDDEFDDSSVDVKWAWRNQGGSSITEGAGWTLLSVPASAASNQLRFRQQAIGVSTFDLRAKIGPYGWPAGNFFAGGIHLYSTTTGNTVALEAQTLGVAPRFAAWNAAFTSVTTIQTASTAMIAARYYRITSNGTVLTAYLSFDGLAWSLLGTRTLAADLTTVSHVGFHMNSNNAAGGDLAVHWFRVS